MEIFKLVFIMIIVVMSLEFCILNLKKKLNDKHPDIFFLFQGKRLAFYSDSLSY